MIEELPTGVEDEEEVEMMIALEGSLDVCNERHISYQFTQNFLLPQHTF
jgi:hypothetical protein